MPAAAGLARLQRVKTVDDQVAQELGFSDARERDRMLSAWISSALAALNAFQRWRCEDGTKDGLLKLPSL